MTVLKVIARLGTKSLTSTNVLTNVDKVTYKILLQGDLCWLKHSLFPNLKKVD